MTIWACNECTARCYTVMPKGERPDEDECKKEDTLDCKDHKQKWKKE
jgi:hypothetical protein